MEICKIKMQKSITIHFSDFPMYVSTVNTLEKLLVLSKNIIIIVVKYENIWRCFCSPQAKIFGEFLPAAGDFFLVGILKTLKKTLGEHPPDLEAQKILLATAEGCRNLGGAAPLPLLLCETRRR